MPSSSPALTPAQWQILYQDFHAWGRPSKPRRAGKAVPDGPPMKGIGFLQSVLGNEIVLQSPSRLSTNRHNFKEKVHFVRGRQMLARQECSPEEVGPCLPQNISMQPSMLVARLCPWQDAAARRPSGIIPKPTAAHTPSSQDFRWGYPNDPRGIPRLDWNLAAHYQSWCTSSIPVHSSSWGFVHKGRRGCDPAAILPFTVAACSN